MTNTCTKCYQPIRRRIRINGKPILLSATRTTCHQCIPYKSRRGREPDLIRRKEVNGLKLRRCTKCDKWYGPEEYYRDIGLICKKCYRTNYTICQKRVELKMRAVVYKGSRCLKCRNIFPICAYSFHHRDPNKKDFQISRAGYTWTDKIVAELDKCDLLCHNCHSIEHAIHKEYLENPLDN